MTRSQVLTSECGLGSTKPQPEKPRVLPVLSRQLLSPGLPQQPLSPFPVVPIALERTVGDEGEVPQGIS